MRQDTTNSAAGSGVTSRQRRAISPQVNTAPNSAQGTASSNGHAKLDEDDFLRRESEQAKKAATTALTDAMRDAGTAVDPRAWTAEHPWIALSVAAVGGFVAATQFVPSRDEQMLKKLEKIRQAVMGETGEDVRERPVESTDSTDHAEKKKGRGFMGIIGTELIRFLGPALSTALSAAIAGKSVAQAADQAQDSVQESQDPSVNTGDPASAI